ncbi:MAG TPA: rhodanese-like domain-containing protein [Opitutaceae bacterium]|nr:rhodanese-like domain-containing protein [Opitutaceae bacterium]
MRAPLRSLLGILAVATLLAAATAAFRPEARALLRDAPRADETTLAAARDHRGPLLWLDARPAADFARAHIPEALPLTADDWDAQIVAVIQRWQPGTRVIVYCDDRACGTSRHVADKLRREYQFDDVRVLHGGWQAWMEASAR